jgi:hypothetical protein
MLLLNSGVEIQCQSKHKRRNLPNSIDTTQDGNIQIFSSKVFRLRGSTATTSFK